MQYQTLIKDNAMKGQQIRQTFKDFFSSIGHQTLPSSPLIPQNDPTLLFANAGMNQFKDYFTGKAHPENKRAVTIQKCVRAGGKHNDLENVGMTPRHQTFFEMLGNFSFGDYFKEEAIKYSWELLTKHFNIPEEKLFVSVYYQDDEAFNLWKSKIGLPESKIFRMGDKDNFWAMGDVGPCGPCSEIYYDYGPEFQTIKNPDPKNLLIDESRYVEIWNLVFMQYNQTENGRENLPNPSIDTGAGLERLACALQGKSWNYDTDLFQPIFSSLEELSGISSKDNDKLKSFRVVADHIRATTMLITDGVLPSNEGRGYVLRRIIRRAVRHLRSIHPKKGQLFELVPAVFDILGKEYPENEANKDLAIKLLKIEEEKFLETLDQGLRYLNSSLENNSGKVFDGREAFKLYDTFGFPLDLTEDILRDKNMTVDIAEFEKGMEEQKEKSRKSWKGQQGANLEEFYSIKEKHGPSEFIGYANNSSQSTLQAITAFGDSTGLVFHKTPFYGESGGQVGDQGIIKNENGKIVGVITDTQKPVDDLYVHILEKFESTHFEIGKTYTLEVDQTVRKLTARNHSATHLLQAALIEVLGNHVKQAGSNVGPEKLRFDFTHPQSLTNEELNKVQTLVNQKIEEGLEVKIEHMTKDQAVESGAMALFGEKYGDSVRVLKMGSFSIELCGGTHVENTNEIGLCIIFNDQALSSGVRRIEGITSVGASKYALDRLSKLKTLEYDLKLPLEKIGAQFQKLGSDLKTLRKEKDQLNDQINRSKSSDLFKNIEKIKDFDLCLASIPNDFDLKKVGDMFLEKFPQGILIAFNSTGTQRRILIKASKKIKSVHCGNALKGVLSKFDGKGGGRPDMAQGSVAETNIENCSKELKAYLTSQI